MCANVSIKGGRLCKDFKEIIYIAPELRALASTKYRPSQKSTEFFGLPIANVTVPSFV